MAALAPLAEFLANPAKPYRSDDVLARARLALIDLIGVTLAGTREPVAAMVCQLQRLGGGEGRSQVIGLPLKASPVDAAFINGVIGHALDFDDSNFVLGGHPSVVLFPGLLALAEQQQLSGRAVLEAYVAGFEVMMRIAATVNFHHYEKGWHPTATLGVFGAAAAAARLMQLDATACANALGLAASFSSGIKENFGSIAKSIQVGNAASRGLLAAQLAAQGATAAQTALDGARGFFEVFNGAQTYNLQQLAIDPDHPELMRSGISFKRYACCGSTHVGIDAALRLRAQAGFDAQKIRSVRLEINARRIPHVNRPVLSEPLAAKFSLQYTVAAALCDGGVGLSHFTPEAITRPDLRALMAKVEIGAIAQTSEALGQPCRLRVQMHDGAELEVSLDGPLGREIEAYPTYMEQKFLDCASQALDMAASRRLFALLCEFENAPDVAALLAASLPLQANDQIPEAARRV